MAEHKYNKMPTMLELTLSAFLVHSLYAAVREMDSPIRLRFPILGSTRDNKLLFA